MLLASQQLSAMRETERLIWLKQQLSVKALNPTSVVNQTVLGLLDTSDFGNEDGVMWPAPVF